MEKKKTWLLVADASKARIYTLCKARIFQEQHPKHLELIGHYDHANSRKKISDLVADKLGEFGAGTFAETTSPKVQEAEQFAHELLRHIEVGRADKSFHDLIIVAPASFMGLLHKHMPSNLHKLISQQIEKDYTQHNESDLLEHLLQHF